MPPVPFFSTYQALTGNTPFPWQEAMYELMVKGRFEELASCNLPTGLGKTSVIAIWLIALGNAPDKVPRRLVYIVNRRTVVDQATDETEEIRKRLMDRPHPEVLMDLFERLASMCSDPTTATPLAISTLRGQFADNIEWRSDPARPAVISGTIDMIGSRLLFSGYGCGFKTRPLHAGFLGQDSLLVHDEAHLEEPFQRLLEHIQNEQRNGRMPDRTPLRVMALTATSRRNNDPTASEASGVFSLTPAEMDPPATLPIVPLEPIHHVWRRLKATKALHFHSGGAEKGSVARKIAALAAEYKEKGKTVLIFVRTLNDVATVQKELVKTKRQVVLLTGTMRGKERDGLVQTCGFRRFLKGATAGKTVYLLCTSAGEVGIDVSADHMVCDLTPFDSMAQRFGRVNRFGDGDALIDVVHPARFDEEDKLSSARKDLDASQATAGIVGARRRTERAPPRCQPKGDGRSSPAC